LQASSTWVQRLLLPGFAFKAVVIGGGYATGRELATFFMSSGPRGGLYGMLLSTVIWSVICSLTFLFALQTNSRDYRTFFRHLLGPLWPAFEIAYGLALIVMLAVYSAAAGAIGEAMFGWPPLIGSLVLMAAIAGIAVCGNEAVERLFKYVTFILYGTYMLLVGLALSRFGERIGDALGADIPSTGWFTGGLTYASYNIVGAVLILPVVRHLTTRRDALIAGVIAGPMAMIPAMLFFICMIAFYPEIADQALPSDYLLKKLDIPALRALFELMIFAALLESATGGIHAINERIAHSYREVRGRQFPAVVRLGVSCAVLTLSVFVATRFGLVELIASGYRWLALVILAIYVLPLLTVGLWSILRGAQRPAQ
jgi:uncharacterized membrane protein YkvI